MIFILFVQTNVIKVSMQNNKNFVSKILKDVKYKIQMDVKNVYLIMYKVHKTDKFYVQVNIYKNNKYNTIC